ncbi:DNA polymerase, partial [uncultured Brachyspira sp.]|uniref:DNA polymerase n=1 Tax=uncultured Brachyspira sp. TaxID=221953 RepID=UPI0026033CFB
KGKQRKELDDCCFIYALQQTGCYDDATLNKMRLRINTRYLSQKSLNELCMEFKLHIKLSFIDEDANGKNKKRSVRSQKNSKDKYYLGIENAEPNRTHTMNVFNKHYFIEEKTPFSTYYINHLSECEEDKYNKEYKQDHWIKARYFINSSDLVRILMKNNYFSPITFGQYKVLNTIFYKDVDSNIDLIDLDYNDEQCTKLIEQPKKKINKKDGEKSYWYADFEADVSTSIHKPYMCVVHSANGNHKKCFKGEDCNKQLLDYLDDESVVYFHNLAYDIRMLANFGLCKSIIKGSKTMMADIKYNNKTIHLRDSLPILSCKLSQLPSMFNIEGIQKEIFPYKYYTLERLKTNIGTISEAGLNEDKQWTDEDYILFNSNIDKIEGCRIDEKHFDMYKYAEFYCQQDVNILRIGFEKLREGFKENFNINLYKFISISSLANEVFNQKVYYPNGNLYKLGGHVRHFCSKAIYGGRCMTAYNKKWHTTKPLSDFDAVSLYPSAMKRLYTVEGKPKVIQPEQLNLEFLSKQSAYIVEIEITKINKHYPFPLIVQKINGLNKNNDYLPGGQTIKMIVDNITLEDYIEFQKIEFNILRGYYWDGKKDYRIRDCISDIFNKRLEYKKQNNPLQNLYKLIMNSCYGKTIEKPVEKDYKYLREGDELDKFWQKNYNKIVEDIQLNNSNIHAVKTLKQIDKHFNFSLLGIQVLSMSKRIMNEVMCLAFDIGCHIYYQDTD